MPRRGGGKRIRMDDPVPEFDEPPFAPAPRYIIVDFSAVH